MRHEAMPAKLAIRVDVDTRIGLKEGVPRLLDLFRRNGLRASFFVSFGPDNTGRALKRLKRFDFWVKMWRTNPFRLYGLRTLLSGTLFSAVPVVEGQKEILKSIITEGHELGIHGYDHVRWQDSVESMEESEIEGELSQAKQAYKQLLGLMPASSAAPGWRCTRKSLEVQDRFNLLYASDARGRCPFLPRKDGLTFKTLQIPTTLPTMDEVLGRRKDTNGFLLAALKEGLNVHTIHAEIEGGRYLSLFEKFIHEIRGREIEAIPLRAVAESIVKNGLEEVPHNTIMQGSMPGRSGWVGCQGA